MKSKSKPKKARAKERIKKRNPTNKNQNRRFSVETEKLIYAAILSICFLLVYLFVFDTKLDLNGDNYNYLNYAGSILQGKGYASPYTAEYRPTNWYPPGYSSILAFAMLFVGKNVVVLKVLNGLFFLGSVLLLFQIMRKTIENTAFAVSVSILLLLNSGLLKLSTIIMSEMPFVFFSMLTIYFVTKLDEHKSDTFKFWRSKYFYGLVLSAVMSYYLRSVGIVLIASLVLHWALQKKWKLASSTLLGIAILYLPWIIRNSIHGIKGRYMGSIMAVNPWRPEEGTISSVGEFVDKMGVNFYDTVLRGFPETIFSFINFNEINKTLIVFLGIITLAFVLFGAWKMKNLRYLFVAYVLGNIAIFLLWHGGNGTRYVWPIVPIITFCFFYGIYKLAALFFQKRGKIMPKYLPYALLFFLFAYLPKLSEMRKKAQQKEHPAYRNYFKMAESIENKNGEKPMVICRKPGMFHFYSDTFVKNYKYSLNDKEVIQGLIDAKADYVIIEQLGYSSTPRYLVPAVNKNQELFQAITHLENPDTYLFRFNIQKAMEKLKM